MGTLVLMRSLRRKAAEGDRVDTHPAGAVIGSVLTPLLLARLDIRRHDRPLGILLGCVIVFFGTKMLLGL